MIKKCLFSILAVFFCCGASNDVYLKDVTVAELKEVFEKHSYKDYIYMPNWKYPRIFLQNLPTDWDKISNNNERNKTFFMITGPLALKVRDDILAERQIIEEINNDYQKNKDFTAEQIEILEAKAEYYEVYTKLKGLRRYQFMLQELILKVDSVPPSILMAVAAISTNWGTSRPAHLANNLYKQLVWYTNEGLEPDEGVTDDYRFKIYASLYDSMKDYAHRINSGVNYLAFRQERKEIRYREKPVFGRSVASSLVLDSNIENFAGLLDYTITFYEIINFDTATLN
ncbi:MAG: glucosaminidase domain-containing protein [Lactobacillus sp.]|jgi:Bax protein|nr:glucosaminidase domain-containing protein [Lactobacillus sp.]